MAIARPREQLDGSDSFFTSRADGRLHQCCHRPMLVGLSGCVGDPVDFGKPVEEGRRKQKTQKTNRLLKVSTTTHVLDPFSCLVIHGRGVPVVVARLRRDQ